MTGGMGKVQNEKLHKLNSAIYYWQDKMQENMTDGICSTNNGEDKCMRNFTCLTRYLVYNVKEIYIYIQGVPGGMWQTSGGCSLC